MKKTLPQAKTLSSQDIARHTGTNLCSENVSQTAEKLEQALKASDGEASLFTLPSISTLSEMFACSYLDMYDAIKLLRRYGYDYHFSSLDGGVEVWRTRNFKVTK